jgi:NAD(P)-dependent dehydrogenase (short-subunit alcohol dehydrogenase family)
MDMLAGQVAIVTGAAGGIGGAIATLFAAEGAKVACLDLSAPELLAEDIRAAGGQAMALATDVADEASTQAAIAAILAAWHTIGVLVNGAALHDPTGTVLELPPPEWHRVFAVHVTGAY